MELLQLIKAKWIKEFDSLSHECGTVDGYFMVGFMRDVLHDAPASETNGWISVPPGLHPASAALIKDMAEQLAAKMVRNQEKYGWTDEWTSKDWEDECRAEMLKHIEKGDPKDVAIYCAFMMHHGWSTSVSLSLPSQP